MQYESQLSDYLESNAKDLMDTIRQTAALPDTDKLDAAIKSFTEGFVGAEATADNQDSGQ